MLTLEDVVAHSDCYNHPLNIELSVFDGVETLVAMGGCNCFMYNVEGNTCSSYCDTRSFAIGKLANGMFVAATEYSDTSGHGCQCDGTVGIYTSLEEALLLGLDPEPRKIARDYLKLGSV